MDKEVAAELDDKAYEAAKFIQQLQEVQDEQFEMLYCKAQKKGWFKGFGADESGACEAKDWLLDYCFNTDGTQLFSEYCSAEWIKMDKNG